MNNDDFVNEVVDILSPPVDSNEITPEQDAQLNALYDKLTAERDALQADLTALREAAQRCIPRDLCLVSNGHAYLRDVLARLTP